MCFFEKFLGGSEKRSRETRAMFVRSVVVASRRNRNAYACNRALGAWRIDFMPGRTIVMMEGIEGFLDGWLSW